MLRKQMKEVHKVNVLPYALPDKNSRTQRMCSFVPYIILHFYCFITLETKAACRESAGTALRSLLFQLLQRP